MERFMEFFRKHPAAIIGAVLGLIFLWWIMGRSSSSGASAASGGIIAIGPSDATISANAAITATTLQTNAAVAMNTQNTSTSLALGQLAAIMNADDNTVKLAMNGQNVGAAMHIANVQGDVLSRMSDNAAMIASNEITAARDIEIQKNTLSYTLQNDQSIRDYAQENAEREYKLTLQNQIYLTSRDALAHGQAVNVDLSGLRIGTSETAATVYTPGGHA